MKGVAGVKYAYTLELRDAGRYGFILPGNFKRIIGKISISLPTVLLLPPANQILPSGRETWDAVYATARELASRVYSDATVCPAL